METKNEKKSGAKKETSKLSTSAPTSSKSKEKSSTSRSSGASTSKSASSKPAAKLGAKKAKKSSKTNPAKLEDTESEAMAEEESGDDRRIDDDLIDEDVEDNIDDDIDDDDEDDDDALAEQIFESEEFIEEDDDDDELMEDDDMLDNHLIHTDDEDEDARTDQDLAAGTDGFDETDEDEDDDDDDDDQIESTMNAILGRPSHRHFHLAPSTSTAASTSSSVYSSASSSAAHYPKIELLIDDQVLPSNMTIYQAIKQYSNKPTSSQSTSGVKTDESSRGSFLDADNDAESAYLGGNAIWSKLHTINYRLAPTPPQTASSKPSNPCFYQRLKPYNSHFVVPETVESEAKNSDNNNNTTNKPSTRQNQKQPKSTPKKQAENDEISNESLMTTSNLNPDVEKTQLWANLTTEWQSRADALKADKSIESLKLLYLLNLMNRNWSLLYRDYHNCSSLSFVSKTHSGDYLIG